MTLLGNLGLWLALLVGIWGALAGFVGGLKDRPDLARSARHAVFAMCAALLVADVSLEWALFQHDFNVEYVAAYTSRNLPVFYTWSALYAGQKGSLLFWASVLSLLGSLAMVLTGRRHRAAAVRGRGRVHGRHVLHFSDAVRAGESLPPAGVHAARRQRAEPAAPEPGDGVPSSDALPRVHLDHHPVRVRDGGSAVEAPRRGLAGRHPQMDPPVLAVPLHRDLSRDVVGLRRARVGWLLGLGPGRERVAVAVAHHDRLPPLGDDPGEARDAEEVEPRSHHRVVAALDFRNVHYTLWRDFERALVHAVECGILFPVLPDRRGDGELHGVRHAPAAARG